MLKSKKQKVPRGKYEKRKSRESKCPLPHLPEINS